jgi:UDP-N-acetylglucosamine:LPS N-acetylglucosamine transferase
VAQQPLRVLLVSSSGGVLLDILGLRPWWSRHQVHWAVVRAPDTEAAIGGMPCTWVGEHVAGRPLSLLRGAGDAARVLRTVRPDVVVSAGSGAAVPFFLVAALRGVPTFWISTLNLVRTPGLAARICARIATTVIVQRQSMLRAHPGAVLVGELY